MLLLSISGISLLLFDIILFTLLIFCAFVAWGQWRQTKDLSIIFYIGYLLFTFAHYGRAFWVEGSISKEIGFASPPDIPLRWNTPTSYAAHACYCLFVDKIMNLQSTEPFFSLALRRMGHILIVMIGVHLFIQVTFGAPAADIMHRSVQMLLFPAMLLAAVGLLPYCQPFYKRLVAIGSMALTLGFITVLASRWVDSDGRYDLLPSMLRCFKTPWGDFCFYHLKVGIAVDVLCFSLALTLRQRELLLASAPLKILEVPGPVTPANVILVKTHGIEDNQDLFLQQVRTFLDGHFHQDSLEVGDIASTLHLTVDQVYRKLKQKTSLTTEQYVLRYRLERAAALLLQTDKTVSEITLDIGLKDLAYFSRAFKKQYGLSPLVFRQTGQIKPD
jgi:AraC-like DNA-binding protein